MMAKTNTIKNPIEKGKNRLRHEIEKKHGKTIEELYEERLKRLQDTIALREPDRIPVCMGTGVFAARYAGLTASVMFYDHEAYRKACLKTILDFEPDFSWAMEAFSSGPVLELLDVRQQRWPGGTLPADIPLQYVEGEYMKAHEYDHFLSDPSDFIMRRYLPRVMGVLEPLASLPPLRHIMSGFEFTGMVSLFSKPGYRELAKKLYQAGRKQEKIRKEVSDFIKKVTRLGFPCERFGGAIGGAPFDIISDHLRGMRGAMLDMFRCPDDLLAACEKILEWRMAQSIPASPENRILSQGMPLHRGSDEFMSLRQFEKFYWPTLKKSIYFNVECGYTVFLFCEGVWNDRLEYLLELPKGKVVCWFERTDMVRAKDILGKHLCIQGNVPPSLLQLGSPREVEEYCKRLNKICGKRGGFILAPGSSIDEAKPENIRAMLNSVKTTKG
jgi:hypothetical protein